MKRCLNCDVRFDGESWTCPACGHAPSVVAGVPAFAPALMHGSGIDVEYRFDALEAAEASHFWFQSRRRLILWALRRYCPHAASILEVGCGTGAVAGAMQSALSPARVTASEVLLEGLIRAQRRFAGVHFIQCDGRRLPFDAEFDVVGAFDVIEHLDDDIAALNELRRVVKPQGSILVTVPQHPSLWSMVDEFSHHRRRYTRSDLTRKLQEAGFTVERVTSFASFVLPLMMISRRVPRPFNPERELRVAPFLNQSLSVLSILERWIVTAGVSLPAGGSLLAVARRRERGE